MFLAHTLMDLEDVAATQALLEEAGRLAGDDPTWQLDAIRGDCALYAGDPGAAIGFYCKSLAWTSESGESHQMLMDLRGLEISLALAGHAESALELFELTRLHERHTGRIGTSPELAEELQQAESHAHELAAVDAAQAAVARARSIPPSLQVGRALELGNRATKHHSR